MAFSVEKDNSFILSFLDFSGGLNTRDLDTIINDKELSDVSNFNFDKRGALKVRKGFTKFGNTAIGAFDVKSVGAYYRTGASMEVIATGSTAIYTVTTISKTAIKSSLTGDSLVFDLHQFFNHYYMANGADLTQVRGLLADGLTMGVWDLGYPIPTSNCTAAQDGTTGGLEAKTYKYKITYYYNDGESNCCSDVTSQLAVAGKSIALSAIPTGDTRVTQRKIYRTIGDGSTYKLLTTLSNNTTVTYTDSIADSGLGADMDTDNDIPPVLHYVVNHKGRLWGMANDSSRVYYSKALHPEAFPAANYWDIGQDDGTVGKALTVNLGLLVIFKDYSTWIISGDIPTGTSADMTLDNANPVVGCVSFKTMAHAGNDLLFLSPNLGVQRLTRVILATSETMDVEAISDKIDTSIKALNKTYIPYACAEVFDHKYHLFVPEGSSQTTNNVAYVLDLRELNPQEPTTIAWTKYKNTNFTSAALVYDTTGERLLCGMVGTGYIEDFGVGTTDDGTAITAYATTKNYECGSFINDKTLRTIATYGRASEDWSFDIRFFINSRGTQSQALYSFSSGIFNNGADSTWDTFLFDKLMYDSNPEWNNAVSDFLKPRMLTQSLVSLIKIKFENIIANSEFAIYGSVLRGVIGNAYIF